MAPDVILVCWTIATLVLTLTLLVADSGSRIPPTDLFGAVSFSTKTLSSKGINRLAMVIATDARLDV